MFVDESVRGLCAMINVTQCIGQCAVMASTLGLCARWTTPSHACAHGTDPGTETVTGYLTQNEKDAINQLDACVQWHQHEMVHTVSDVTCVSDTTWVVT